MKKINFLSSTKLLMATIGLIIGAFTLLSMSFPDPAYSGPNVNGPKYSHTYTAGSCGGSGTATNHNDYSRVTVASAGNGSVSITEASKGTINPGTVVNWNCGLTENKDHSSDWGTYHTNTITLSATPDDGYAFDKWVGTNGDESGDATYTVDIQIPNDKEYKSSSPYSVTYTAYFREKVSATVTMSAAVGGSYTYSCPAGNGTVSTENVNVTTADEVTFTAVPAEGYSFYGWYTIEEGNVEYFSHSETAVKAFGANTTIYAKFISEKAALFTVGGTTGTQYWDLNEANAVAAAASKKTIVLANDGVLEPGNYTISSSVQLIIPYESTASKGLTSPTVARNSTDAIEPFRTLTITDGTTITVNGTLIVAGSYQSGDNSHNPSGFPVGPVGAIDMSDGGHIQLAANSKLYAWGFIQGRSYLDGANVGKDGTVYSGTITAANGSTIYESFGLGDWGGGSYVYAVGMNDKSYKIFPFQSYFVQNIEVPLRIEYGAKEIIQSSVFAAKGDREMKNINFIGSGSDVFFKVGSSGAVTKWYDGTTDHMVVELEGNSSLDNLKFSMSFLVFSVAVQSKEFDTPIMSNMHIKLKNCNLTISSPLAIQPGGIFEIPEGSSLTVKTNLYVYGTKEWGTFAQKKYFIPTPRVLTPHINRGSGTTNTLEDAQLIVDGKLTIASDGAMYTTASGANLWGENGGHVVWERTLPENGHVYGYNNGSSVDGSDTSSKLKPANIVDNESSAGWMHNENGSYTEPLDNETFDNLHGRWFVHSAAIAPNADHTYNFTYLNEGVSTTVKAVYSADKTGLVAGYKWMNVTENVTYTCGDVKTFTGEDGNLYTYKNGDWMQLVQIGTGATFGGSDDNLYMFADCDWVSVGEIGDDCLYTIDGVKKALVGSEFVQLAKNSFDEAFHNVANASDYYMLFDGCTWQHADKVADQEKAYNVRGGFYIWIDEWVLAEPEGSDMYYTTDNQNLKHFYQYDAELGKWGAARMRVRVISEGGDEAEFIYFEDAMAQASTVYNPTVTLLANHELTPATEIAINTIAKSNKFTLDLNGYTATLTRSISGTSTAGVGNRFFNITSNMAVKIMDSSDEQNGQIRCLATGNAYARGITVTDGSLTLEGGKLYVQNDAPYASNSSERVYAVVVAAGKTFTMNGGEIEAASEYYGWGVVGSGSASARSTINMTGGVINANAYYDARGIYSTADVNMNGGTVNATTGPMFSKATGHQYAYGIYVNASANATEADAYHGKLLMTGGTVNAYAVSNYAYGVYVQGAAATMTNSKANISSAEAVINGGTINATSKTTTVYGVFIYGGPNSYSKSADVKTVINNATINATGTNTVYGIFVQAGVADLNVGLTYGIAEINDCNVTATSTSSTNAYGVYVNAATRMLNDVTYSQVSATNKKTWCYKEGSTVKIASTDGTNTYSYVKGYYGCGAKAIINGGTFTAITKTYGAYGAYCGGSCLSGPEESTTPQIEVRGELTIHGGTFNAKSTSYNSFGVCNYGTTIVDGGIFNATPTTYGAYGAYGYRGTMEIQGGTFNVTATTKNAYGVVANGWIDGNRGIHAHGLVTVTDGVFNVSTTKNENAYGVWANVASNELTEATYQANVYSNTNNKKYYYSTATNATVANYYLYRYGKYYEGGELVVNGGTFNVTSKTSAAYGMVVASGSYTGTDVIYPKATINGGLFKVTSGTANSAFAANTDAVKENFVVTGGHFNVKGNLTSATATKNYVNTPYHVLDCQEPALMATYPYEVAEAYNVTFKNGSSVLQEGLVKKGATPAYAGATPTKEADAQYTYAFSTWSPALAVVTGEATYTAQFNQTLNKYTVTWNAAGGTLAGDYTNGLVDYGTRIVAPTVSKTGYDFAGWGDIPETVTGNVSLTANWNPTAYTITYTGLEGASNSNPTSYTIESATINFVNPGERIGYTFQNWSPTSIAAGSTGNMTVTASWTKNSQTSDDIVAGDGDHSTDNADIDVTVETNATSMTVHADGVVKMSANINLSGDLVLEATETASGEIINNGGSLNVDGNVYFDLALDITAHQWYAVAVPWQVDATSGISIKGGKNLVLGTDEDVVYYDGASRATNGYSNMGKNVVFLEDIVDKTMYPGKMYFLYFAQNLGNVTIRFTKKSGADIFFDDDIMVNDYAEYTTNESDKGWNGIANPMTYKAKLNAGVEYGQAFQNGEYQPPFELANEPFVVGRPVMVQTTKDRTVVIEHAVSGSSPAPRRVAAEAKKMTVELYDGNRMCDRIFVSSEEDKENRYVIGSDLAKAGVSTRVAQMWVNRYNTMLAVNAQAPDADGNTEFPLVLQATHSGEYDIQQVNTTDSDATLYLTYQGKNIWNLSIDGYTLWLDKGQTSEYGLRLVGSRVTTSMGQTENDAQALKFMQNGILYIQRGEHTYDAQGQLLK